MSLFTKDAYAGMLQPQGEATRAVKTAAGGSREQYGRADPMNRVAALKSEGTARSAALSTSDFDPLSPANLARAADPWYDNNLVPAASGEKTVAKAPVKANLSLIEAPKDDEWGEFVTFSPLPADVAEEFEESDVRPAKKPTGERERGRHARHSLASMPTAEREERMAAGYSPLGATTEHSSSQPAYSRPPYLARSSMPNLPVQRSTGSFTDLLVERISATLRGAASSSNLNRSSSFGGLFSFGSASSAQTDAPPRSYDSYDVTFERGPIGLQLETDWYGRQAVVKGFKKINDGKDDGPAKLCGIIRVGDVLTAINGDPCLEMSFPDTLAKLRSVSHERHILHFKSLEAAGDLSVYSNDVDIVQAKKFIHQNKERFYQPPPPVKTVKAREGQESSNQLRRRNDKLIYGCIERLRGPTVTTFNFHREDTGEFLLACSCVNEATGVFIFHTLQDSHLREFRDLPQSEDSAVYLGQMTPNFIGTEFTLLDHQQKRRNELGFIEYNSNVLGRVPNFLKCVFPRPRKTTNEDEVEDRSAGDECDGSEEGEKDAESSEASDEQTQEQPDAKPSQLQAVSSGMGNDSARFNTHNTMMDRNGNISDRYKRLKQSRSLSLVERFRTFTINDLDVNLELAAAEVSAATESFESAWLDDDDHAGRARVMRVKQARLAGRSRDPDSSMPYGALEADDYQCDLLVFETKKPSWSETLGAWTLNFHGRVKMASKKNFLLVAEQGNEQMEHEFTEDRVYLRFGKVSKTRFSLDYAAPLSPILALAIAASSFAHKIAVT